MKLYFGKGRTDFDGARDKFNLSPSEIKFAEIPSVLYTYYTIPKATFCLSDLANLAARLEAGRAKLDALDAKRRLHGEPTDLVKMNLLALAAIGPVDGAIDGMFIGDEATAKTTWLLSDGDLQEIGSMKVVSNAASGYSLNSVIAKAATKSGYATLQKHLEGNKSAYQQLSQFVRSELLEYSLALRCQVYLSELKSLQMKEQLDQSNMCAAIENLAKVESNLATAIEKADSAPEAIQGLRKQVSRAKNLVTRYASRQKATARDLHKLARIHPYILSKEQYIEGLPPPASASVDVESLVAQPVLASSSEGDPLLAVDTPADAPPATVTSAPRRVLGDATNKLNRQGVNPTSKNVILEVSGSNGPKKRIVPGKQTAPFSTSSATTTSAPQPLAAASTWNTVTI